MAKTFRTYLPEQNLLLPASLREWLPDDHLSYFVSDVVDQLDLSAIECVYEGEERGQPPYHPRMMTKILVYGYCVGVFSSRRIQKRLVEGVAFRMLAAGNQPDFRTLSDFWKVHLRPRGAGRKQGEDQREQAQGDELWTDAGDQEAAAGGSPEVAEPS